MADGDFQRNSGEQSRDNRGPREGGGFRIRLSDNEMRAARAVQEAFGVRSTVAALGLSLRTVAQLIEEGRIDSERIEFEMAMLADKLDVREEVVRMDSHLGLFREAMASGEPVGRKMNFLSQEMNREINTIGSKSNDADMAHLVVGMKEELEKIKEQVENVE